MTALVMAAGTGIAWAEEDSGKVVPVEMYACTYNDGMGPADLDKVIGKWTSWADKQGLVLDLLFFSVNQVIKTFAADPQWRLAGNPGFIGVLHTWTQTMMDHFHLHS